MTCADATTCSACMTGYTEPPVSNACTACVGNCYACVSATTCSSCHAGYFIDTAGCTACIANCTACTDGTTCTAAKCAAGYVNNATTNVCDSCPSNCGNYVWPATCTDTATCTTAGCNTGYFKATAGGCSACGANCNACSSATVCTTCATGFFVVAGACTSCAANCDTCTVANECATTGCSTGFTFMGTNNDCSATLTTADCATN